MLPGPRLVIFAGIALLLLGLLWATLPSFRLGRLPGDFSFGGERWRVSLPIATSLVLSLALTIILNLVGWLFRLRR